MIQATAMGAYSVKGTGPRFRRRGRITFREHSRSRSLSVNGPLEVQSVEGSRYFITFIDDLSSGPLRTQCFTSQNPCRASRCITSTQKPILPPRSRKSNVLARSSNSGSRLKALRTDNGGEYLSTEFKNYLAENGIEHQLTVAYTPQQNGVAEWMNRTLVDLVRSMLHSKGPAKRFWAEAL